MTDSLNGNGAAAVIVPVRSFRKGKTRLMPALSDRDREALGRQMFGGVIAAARDSLVKPTILVVSPDEEVLAEARSMGGSVIALLQRAPEGDLNGALAEAVGTARQMGFGSVLILPADLPLLAAADIQNLLRRDAPVIIAPDRHGQGTNALLIRLDGGGSDFQLKFGEGSYARHRDEAHRLGLDVASAIAMGTSFDLDTPEDLVELGLLRAVAAGAAKGATGAE